MSGTARLAVALSLAAHALVFLLPWPGGEVRRLFQVRLITGERRQERTVAPSPTASLPMPALARESAAEPDTIPTPAVVHPDLTARAAVALGEGRARDDDPRPPETRAAATADMDGGPAAPVATDAARAERPRPAPAVAGAPAGVAVAGGDLRGAIDGSARPDQGEDVQEQARSGTAQSVPAAPPELVDVLPLIRERILAAREYPPLARKRGWEGRNRVRFRVGEGGWPEGVELLESSGIRLLDQCSVRAVEAAAPYPLYDGWIVVPIAYELKS